MTDPIMEFLKSVADPRDGDGDGTIFDGTPKERPVRSIPKKSEPKKPIVTIEHIDSYERGVDSYRAYAKDQDKTVGVFDYDVFSDYVRGEWKEVIKPNNVMVDPDHRRLGIATQLYEAVLNNHPDAVLGRAMTTDDGTPFRSSIESSFPDRMMPDPETNVEIDFSGQWDDLAKRNQSGEITYDQYVEESVKLQKEEDEVDSWNRLSPHERFPEHRPSRIREWAGKKFKNPSHAKAFSDWFGESKAIDDNGHPAVMYHGTTSNFLEFDRKISGRAFDSIGSWFSTYPGSDDPGDGLGASNYAGGWTGEGLSLVPAYLKIENPYITSFKELIDLGKREGGVNKHGVLSKESTDAIRGWLRNAGYDGIKIVADSGVHPFSEPKLPEHETFRQTIWVALEPTQIKSATGNDGSFDPKSPRIDKSHDPRDGDGDGLINDGTPEERPVSVKVNISIPDRDSPKEQNSPRSESKTSGEKGRYSNAIAGYEKRVSDLESEMKSLEKEVSLQRDALDKDPRREELGWEKWRDTPEFSELNKKLANKYDELAMAKDEFFKTRGYISAMKAGSGAKSPPTVTVADGVGIPQEVAEAMVSAMTLRLGADESESASARWKYHLNETRDGTRAYGDARYQFDVLPVSEPDRPPSDKVVDSIPNREGFVYRGMSHEEWEEAKKTGELKSLGTHNIGQEGLTFYGSSDTAAYYASGFAPANYQPGADIPSTVVEIPRSLVMDSTDRDDIPQSEFAHLGGVPISEISNRWEVHATKIKPGRVEIVSESGKLRIGSRSDPRVDYEITTTDDSKNEPYETKEFKEWFGDSKVVDDKGNPLVVYHGTRHEFDEFDMKKPPSHAAILLQRDVSYFTSSEETANSFAGDEENSHVKKVYLKMENPLVIDAEGRNFQAVFPEPIDKAKNLGHDGLIVKNLHDSANWANLVSDIYVVFEPAQIKSATGNSGSFDPKNPNINKSHDPRDGDGDGFIFDGTQDERPSSVAVMDPPPAKEKKEQLKPAIGFLDPQENDWVFFVAGFGQMHSDAYAKARETRPDLFDDDGNPVGEYNFDLFQKEDGKYIDRLSAYFTYGAGSSEGVNEMRILDWGEEQFKNEKFSENFSNWFEGSKIIDEDGNPLPVYHITKGVFTEFAPKDPKLAGSGPAFWFSPDPDMLPAAHQVGRGTDTGTSVMKVYLNIKNPLVLKRSDGSMDKAKKYQEMSDGYNRAFPMMITMEQKNLVEDDGYDGIIIDMGIEGFPAEYIAFYPEQIKSATGNEGTFDPESADISKSFIKSKDPRDGDGDGFIFDGTVDERKVSIEPISKRQTESKEFKSWFKESAAVNRDGSPKVLYHGTRNEFTEFSQEKLGGNTRAYSAVLGFFFTDEPETAASYQDGANYVSRMNTALVSFTSDQQYEALEFFNSNENDLFFSEYDSDEGGWLAKYRSFDQWGAEHIDDDGNVYESEIDAEDALIEFAEKEREGLQKDYDEAVAKERSIADSLSVGGSIMPVYLSVQDPLIVESAEPHEFEGIIKEAIEDGDHDGVWIKSSMNTALDATRDSEIWIVFDPTKIKSATGNDGSFDPKDPDISKSFTTIKIKNFELIIKSDPPRDADGDGMIYDGLPEERPATNTIERINQPKKKPRKPKPRNSQSPEKFNPMETKANINDVREKRILELEKSDPSSKELKDLYKEDWEFRGVRAMAFKRWFGDWEGGEDASKVVDKNGTPMATPPSKVLVDGEPRIVYHGTTHEFDEFNVSEGNTDNSFGVGAYFSSDLGDVRENYAGTGPDLTSRIGTLTDQLFEYFSSESIPVFSDLGIDTTDGISEEEMEVLEEAALEWASNVNVEGSAEDVVEYFKKVARDGEEEYPDEAGLAEIVARSQLVGPSPKVISSYLNIKNPIVLDGKNGTQFNLEYDIDPDYIKEIKEEMVSTWKESDIEFSQDEADRLAELDSVEELMEEINSITDREIESDLWQINNRFEDEKYDYETEGEDIKKLRHAASMIHYDDGDANIAVDEIIAENVGSLMSADELINELSKNSSWMYMVDYDNANGAMVAGQALSDLFAGMGFDGIEDRNVASRFPGMNLSRSTVHYIVWDPKKIKSVDNEGSFDPDNRKFNKSLKIRDGDSDGFIHDGTKDERPAGKKPEEKKHSRPQLVKYIKEFRSMGAPSPFGDGSVIFNVRNGTESSDDDTGLIKVLLKPFDGNIHVHEIAVLEGKTGRGYGSYIMQKLTDFADEKGVSLTLIAEPLSHAGKKIPKKKLIKFYEGFGFSGQDGRKSESMIRKPVPKDMAKEDNPVFSMPKLRSEPKTIKEAEEYAIKAGLAKKANYKKISVEYANRINRVLESLKEKYGESFDEIKTVKRATRKGAEISMTTTKTYDGPDKRLSNTALVVNGGASEYFRKNLDYLNGAYNIKMDKDMSDLEILEEFKSKDSRDRWTVNPGIDGEIAHEYGHLLTANSGTIDEALADGLSSKKFADSSVSQYAGYNGHETLAEIFSAYQLNPDLLTDEQIEFFNSRSTVKLQLKQTHIQFSNSFRPILRDPDEKDGGDLLFESGGKQVKYPTQGRGWSPLSKM